MEPTFHSRYHRLLLLMFTLGLVIDILLAIFLGVLYHRVDVNDRNVHAAQAAQARDVAAAVCPLYKAFIISEAVLPTPVNPTAAQTALRERSIEGTARGYAALGC